MADPIGVIDHNLGISRNPTAEEIISPQSIPGIEFVYEISGNTLAEQFREAEFMMRQFNVGPRLANRILADDLPPEIRAHALSDPSCQSSLASDACNMLLISLSLAVRVRESARR